jgi:Tol biopolymer transport system component
MKLKKLLIVLLLTEILFLFGCQKKEETTRGNKEEGKELPVRKLPNMKSGAEFYFSPDGKSIIGNAKYEGDESHKVYTINIDGTNLKKINDKGEDACSYYFPDGKKIIWTSTRDNLDLPKGDWSDARNYPTGAELYTSDLDGNNVVRLTHNKYYDAEVSVSPDGKKILFTRSIDGKCDLWVMDVDGKNERQITFTEEWQEGGSFYLKDSETIIYRAWERKSEGQRGMPMTIFTIKDDGTDLKQITHDDGTNWAPHPAPDGDHFAFIRVLPPMNFEIFIMSIKTGEQIRMTYNDAFDGFPVISEDGNTLAFSSNRDEPKGVRNLSPYFMDISSLNLGKR